MKRDVKDFKPGDLFQVIKEPVHGSFHCYNFRKRYPGSGTDDSPGNLEDYSNMIQVPPGEVLMFVESHEKVYTQGRHQGLGDEHVPIIVETHVTLVFLWKDQKVWVARQVVENNRIMKLPDLEYVKT